MAKKHFERVKRGQVISSCVNSFSFREGLCNFPGLIKRVIQEKCWKEFVCEQTGHEVTFTTFEEFVTAELPEGLSTTLRDVKNVCRDDVEALSLIDETMQGEAKKDNNPTGKNQHSKGEEVNVDNVHSDHKESRPTGNTRDRALRKLRKDRPDLHRKVVAGKMSAHAAMVEAGFRQHPIHLPHIKH